VLHALAAVAARTREPALVERFAREWKTWTAAQNPVTTEDFDPASGQPLGSTVDAFSSAWLDTFFRAAVLEPLVDCGPLRVDGLPFKEQEISVER